MHKAPPAVFIGASFGIQRAHAQCELTFSSRQFTHRVPQVDGICTYFRARCAIVIHFITNYFEKGQLRTIFDWKAINRTVCAADVSVLVSDTVLKKASKLIWIIYRGRPPTATSLGTSNIDSVNKCFVQMCTYF